MKKLSLLILLLATIQCMAQNDSNKVSDYRCVVMQLSGAKLKGQLYQAADSFIMLWGFNDEQRFVNMQVAVSNIKMIKVRRKGDVRSGLWYGVLVGGVAGTIIGLSLPAEPQGFVESGLIRTVNTVVGLGVGAVGGGLTGMLIGSAGITFPIRGNQKNYERSRQELIRYTLMQK